MSGAKVTLKRFFSWFAEWPDMDSSWTAEQEIGETSFRLAGEWIDDVAHQEPATTLHCCC